MMRRSRSCQETITPFSFASEGFHLSTITTFSAALASPSTDFSAFVGREPLHADSFAGVQEYQEIPALIKGLEALEGNKLLD
jgi:hypothetical protein